MPMTFFIGIINIMKCLENFSSCDFIKKIYSCGKVTHLYTSKKYSFIDIEKELPTFWKTVFEDIVGIYELSSLILKLIK